MSRRPFLAPDLTRCIISVVTADGQGTATGRQDTNTQINSTQIHKYNSTQIHKYNSTQIHKYNSTQIRKYNSKGTGLGEGGATLQHSGQKVHSAKVQWSGDRNCGSDSANSWSGSLRLDQSASVISLGEKNCIINPLYFEVCPLYTGLHGSMDNLWVGGQIGPWSNIGALINSSHVNGRYSDLGHGIIAAWVTARKDRTRNLENSDRATWSEIRQVGHFGPK